LQGDKSISSLLPLALARRLSVCLLVDDVGDAHEIGSAGVPSGNPATTMMR
jgi:hypothetical protein